MRRKRDARGGGGQKESRSIVGQALRGRGWGGAVSLCQLRWRRRVETKQTGSAFEVKTGFSVPSAAI